jgi:hypothetical protein
MPRDERLIDAAACPVNGHQLFSDAIYEEQTYLDKHELG